MRQLTVVLAVMVLVGFSSTMVAQEKPSLLYGTAGSTDAAGGKPEAGKPQLAKPTFMYATVVSVDAAGGKVVVAPKDGPQVTVATDTNTMIHVSGTQATLGEVKPGMILRVSPTNGTAAYIRAFVPSAPK